MPLANGSPGTLLALDQLLTGYVNMWSGRHFWLDAVARTFTSLYALRMGVLLTIAWLVWARQGLASAAMRLYLLRFALGVVLALAVARILNAVTFFRARPALDAGWQLPRFTSDVAMTAQDLHFRDANSFPSDHASLSFAIATAIFRLAPGWGGLAYAWAAFGVCLPRIFLGDHYVGDVVAGAVLGVAAMSLSLRLPVPAALLALADQAERRCPGLTVALAFLLSAFCFTMFYDVQLALAGLHDARAATP